MRPRPLNFAATPVPPTPPALASVSGSAAGPNSHKCTTCGHVWESIDDKTAKDVRKAAQVNGQGPSCGLCMHLEMAYRYAEAQGYRTFTDAVTQWLNTSKPQNVALTDSAEKSKEAL